MLHHFTVDVEEYFHPTPVEPWIPRSEWERLGRRSAPVIHRLLEVLDAHNTRATFFILGWLAEREPEMVRAIASAGHEIASHGWNHRVVTNLTPEEFRSEVRRSREVLQELTGVPVVGYRAPSFSIVPGLEWAFEVLVEEGYQYDSSLFPVRLHPTYGYPCDRDPHLIHTRSGPLAEMPPVTLRVLGTNFPAAGGAYFRFFPFHLLASALRQAEGRDRPGTFYIHPWEFDSGLPEHGIPWTLRLRTRGRSGDLWTRTGKLLDRFEFERMDVTAHELLRERDMTDTSVYPDSDETPGAVNP
jgi:polysaccharide deacetylase family protein (PEP-CTERM system associated)